MWTHVKGHVDQLEPSTHLWDEIDRSAVGHGTDTDQTPPERRILTNAFTERPALEVEHEGRDLLRQAKEIDRGVEQTRLELLLEISTLMQVFDRLGEIGDIDECDNVDGELQQDREEYIEVENVAEGPFLAQFVDGLMSAKPTIF